MREIRNIENNLEIELNKFWDWSGKSPEQYSMDRGYGEWEVDYPNWIPLIICFNNAVRFIKRGHNSERLVSLLLDVIALDNEGETLLDECVTSLDDNDFEFIIQCSITHIQSEARWQIASMIGIKQKKKWERYLLKFIEDNNKYVQRRALLALYNFDVKKATTIALLKIKDEDEYMRLASLDILYLSGYENLVDVMKLLKYDKSLIIQQKIRDINKK
ncbi:hypothetical protein [Clostridium sediminicola]|uniref:hypothetical protein n=1 Tax=Clostridium sediminicola TaxID=3114879 RepID=UPI003D16E3C9